MGKQLKVRTKQKRRQAWVERKKEQVREAIIKGKKKK